MNADGVPFRAFAKARALDQIAMSQPVFDEIAAVLDRPGLRRFIDAILCADLLDQLLSATIWFVPSVHVTDCRDPRENKYLELALAAAAAIVTGDRDLLVLHPWSGIEILSPVRYLSKVDRSDAAESAH